MIPESSIDPVDMESLAVRRGLRRGRRGRDPDDRGDQAQRRARHLDGHGPRQVAAVRAPRAVLPRHHRPAGAAPARGVRRPAAADLHEQLPHVRATRWPRWRATRTSRSTGCRWSSCRTRSPSSWRRTSAPASWPKDPDLEWCPPGHGDLYTALRGTGLLDRLIEAGYRTSSSPTPTTSARSRTPGWPAGSPAAVRRSRSRRSAVPRRTARAATSRAARTTAGSCSARPRRRCPRTRRRWPTWTGTGSARPTTCGSTWSRCATSLDARDGILGLPLIRNVKTLDPGDPSTPEVIQIETAMGAAIEVFEGSRLIEVGRDRFVPVKTTNDLLVLRSDVYDIGTDFVLDQVAAEVPYVELDRRLLQAGRRVRQALPRGRAVDEEGRRRCGSRATGPSATACRSSARSSLKASSAQRVAGRHRLSTDG